MLAKSRFTPRVAADHRAVELIGSSAAARGLRDAVDLAVLAPTALIVAPQGYDAVAVAAAVHARAAAGAPLVTIDCAAADGRTLEHDLFGTRTDRARATMETVGPGAAIGRARGGTLVLARVAELPTSLQTRLARILRDGEVRMNGAGAVPLNVRLIATTDLPLEAEIEEGRFRKDLYRRLAAHLVIVPPIAERREDIGPIAVALMERCAASIGRAPRVFTRAALALLSGLAWSGNVAELRDMISALAAAGATGPIRVEDILAQVDPGAAPTVAGPRASLRDARRQFEREYIAAVLRHSGWRMEQAARVLGIQRTNLYRKARQLGIARTRAGGR